jgi:uncharacterized protein (TIGR02246 family)
VNKNSPTTDEIAVRELIEDWAKAVRARDIDGILADHATDVLMFDVPPPAVSRGLEAYRETWNLFYSAQPEPIAFDIQEMKVVANGQVAFAVALMQCAERGKMGERLPLDFRLTVGLCKIGGRWMVVHEHHSIPAE